MSTAAIVMATAFLAGPAFEVPATAPEPDPLVFASGAPVRTRTDWERRRREILRLFQDHVYGRTPRGLPKPRAVVVSEKKDAREGRAVRKEIDLVWGDGAVRMRVLLYVPTRATKPVPAFLGLNFCGNACTTNEPDVALPDGWMREGPGVENHRATPALRGVQAQRWPIGRILERGYAVATAYYGDLDPDFDDGFRNGVHALRPRTSRDHDWGAIAAWAYGLSRALDQLEREPAIDRKRVVVHGLSRLGKTALWAAALDRRFAMAIATGSGCAGAALSKRPVGEDVEAITRNFPHWFAPRFATYARNEAALPLDQHLLIALIAPRPVYVASAQDDTWADPVGELLGAKLASPVWTLLGHEGLALEGAPELGVSYGTGRVGYHVRTGGHELTAFDWEKLLDFADKHLRGGALAATKRTP